jgi:NTP pyrophosphatase (non-canonical NTP hydrolase)
MTTISEIHDLVWSFRRENSDWWLTPSPDDCLRYAFTEAGELMDAWLRSKRPDDARNNDRQRDVAKELADVAIMLVSAMPELKPVSYAPLKHPTIDDVCVMVGCCLDAPVVYGVVMDALIYAERYAEQHHIDLLAHVQANLEAIRLKNEKEDA